MKSPMIAVRLAVAMVAPVGALACGSSAATTPDASAASEDGSTGDAATLEWGAIGDAGPGDAQPGDTEPTDAKADALGDAGRRLVDAACSTGSVNFQMESAPTSGRGFCVYFSMPDSPSWIGVRPAEGGALSPWDPCPTIAACDSCFCNGGSGYMALGDGGAQATWNGTYYVSGPGTCGRCGPCGQCYTQACAPPGSYVATFCAYPTGPDGGCDTSTTICTDTPFTWPPADGGVTVRGVVGP